MQKSILAFMALAGVLGVMLSVIIIKEDSETVTPEAQSRIVGVINSEYTMTDSYPQNKTELEALMVQKDVTVPDKAKFNYSVRNKDVKLDNGKVVRKQAYSLVVKNEKKPDDKSSIQAIEPLK